MRWTSSHTLLLSCVAALLGLARCTPAVESGSAITASAKSNEDFFGGQLVYAVTTEYYGDNPRHRAYYEREKFGDSVFVTVAPDGRYRRDYPSAGPRGYDFTLYLPATNTVYAGFNFMDTVLSYRPDASALTGQLIRTLSTEELDCRNCAGLLLTGRDSLGGLDVRMRFTYRPDGPAVNAAAWARNRDLGAGELFARSGRHWDEIDCDFGNYRVVMRLARATPGPVADEAFAVPAGRPVKLE